ncbi:hypothetical protein CHS0354_035938 [Potamilus streckersoni]|uniref:SAP domain-containing protein n=1 Tax=Potamilus streckersoni TaxID=2493646 RepID=A0AAE0TFZ6_9BIVA|nr:hypothetical protein CHS0354_035938 [Potamilus streckersoni]
MLSKDTMLEKLKEPGKKVAGKDATAVTNTILSELGLFEDLLSGTPPCPRPENMTLQVLNSTLEERGLLTTGTRKELEAALRRDDLDCKLLDRSFTLPVIRDPKLLKHLYYFISPACVLMSAWISPLPRLLISYDWGRDEVLELNANTIIRFSIDKDDEKKVFVVNASLKLCVEPGNCIWNGAIVEKMEIPIPICNEDFKLPRNRTHHSLRNSGFV